MLVLLRVDIGGHRSSTGAIVGAVSEKLKPCLDVGVAWIQLSSPLVGIQSIVNLVVAALVQCAKIVPNLRDEGIQADSTRICVQSIPVLINLVVKHTDGAPEGRIATIAVDSLLVRLVCFRILGLRHVASTEKVPTLSVAVVCRVTSASGGCV